MSLNIGVASVDLTDDYRLRVVVGVSVTGFTSSVDYSGAISVANAPQSDNVEIEGTVGTGAGDEHVVTLDAGLHGDDLPTEVLITAALDDGTQEQATVRVEPAVDDDEEERRRDVGGITGTDVAALVGAAAISGAAFKYVRSN